MIYIFDIHSTIFDEHQEYAPALNSAISVFIDKAGGIPSIYKSENDFYKAVYADIKKAHILLQSDWDNRAFDLQHMPSLRSLFKNDIEYNTIKDIAIQTRRDTSKKLIKQHSYHEAIELIKNLKKAGHTVYLCTDSNRSFAVDAIGVLGVEGDIDGYYCCASPGVSPLESEVQNNKIKCLSDGVFKPNSRIIGEIILDHAKNNLQGFDDIKYEDVFQTTHGKHTIIEKEWVNAKVVTNDDVLRKLMNDTVFIGDSLQRDVLLGNNAGVLTVEAKYGTKSPGLHDSHEVIHAVTYWENAIGPDGKETDRWSLMSPHIKKAVLDENAVPNYVCGTALSEIESIVKMQSRAEVKAELEKLSQLNHEKAGVAIISKL